MAVVSDKVGDMLTRIRNAQRVRHATVRSPSSRLRKSILDVLLSEGYIRGYTVEKIREGIEDLIIELKYYEGQPVIREISRVSTPGLRRYSPSDKVPSFYNGLGINIISTSHGVMSDMKARQMNVGGEIICRVY